MHERLRHETYPEQAYIPTGASRTLPASEERIQTYRSRAQANRPVFVEGDIEEDDRRAFRAPEHAANGKPARKPRYERQTASLEERVEEGGRNLPPLHLCSKIRLLRKRLGLTQRELARRAGMSYRAVRYYEYGTYYPRWRALLGLARALCVTPAELMGA